MTHAEQIVRAVAALVKEEGNEVFTRAEVRKLIGVTPEEWHSGYTAIFQGMRADHPGGAPAVGDRWKGVFRRVEYARYTLSDRGRQLLAELEEGGSTLKAGTPEAARTSLALGGFMKRLRDVSQWQTLSGDTVTVGDVSVTPESKALIVRWPYGGLVWNRPVAVLVDKGEQTERIRIVDVTRMVQLGLLALSFIFSLVIFILSVRRRRYRNE